MVLTVTATDNGNDPAPLSSAPATTTIELWQVTTSATLIGADSSTTLTVNLQVPVPGQNFQLAVNWGDGQTFNETIHPGVNTFQHFYVSNPDTVNPASAIPISVFVSDTQRHVDSAPTAAPVPGTGLPGILVTPTTTLPPIVVTSAPLLVGPPSTAAIEAAVAEPNDPGVATGEVTTSNERHVVLRIVNPSGGEGANILMPDRVLDDLPDLFRRLPDGRYRVYLMEGGRERLVIDAVVRQGRPVDPSQESSGTLDRPPTSQSDHAGSQRVASAPHTSDSSRMIAQPTTVDPAAEPTDIPATDAPAAEQVSPPTENVSPPVENHSDGLPVAPRLETPSAAVSPPASDVAVEPRDSEVAGRATAAPPLHGQPVAWAETALGLGLAATVAGDAAAAPVDAAMSRLSRRSLTKSARLARRLRRAMADR